MAPLPGTPDRSGVTGAEADGSGGRPAAAADNRNKQEALGSQGAGQDPGDEGDGDSKKRGIAGSSDALPSCSTPAIFRRTGNT